MLERVAFKDPKLCQNTIQPTVLYKYIKIMALYWKMTLYIFPNISERELEGISFLMCEL